MNKLTELISLPAAVKDDKIVGFSLPQVLSVKIHEASNLYKPYFYNHIKMDPYVTAYLSTKKGYRQQTPYKSWGQSNPKFDSHELLFPYVCPEPKFQNP